MPVETRSTLRLLTVGLGAIALVALVALLFALRTTSDRSSQIDQLSADLSATTEERDTANATIDDLEARVEVAHGEAAVMRSRWLAGVAVGGQFSPNESRLLAVEAVTSNAGPTAMAALGTVLFADSRLASPVIELGHEGPVWVTAISASGEIVATGSHDGTVKLWSGEGNPLATLTNPGEVLDANFSPNAGLLASGSRDGTATVWTVDGHELTTATHSEQVNAVAITSDDASLVSGGHDGIALVTTISSGATEHRLAHPDIVWSVAISTDDQHVATGGKDGLVRVWDLGSGDLIADYAVGASVETLSYSPNGEWLFAGGQQGRAFAIRLANGEATQLENQSFRGGIVDVDWHPDGSEIALISLGGVHRYALSDLTLVAEHRVAGGARGIAYGPDGSWLASASGDFQFSFGQIIFWDAASGKELVGLNLGGPVETIKVTSQGTVLAGFRMVEDLVEVGGAWLIPGPEEWINLACEGTDGTIGADTWNQLSGRDESPQTSCP